MSFTKQFPGEAQKRVEQLNTGILEKAVDKPAHLCECDGWRFILGVVGHDGGYTPKEATACAIVPTVNPAHMTPHSQAFQAAIRHSLVSHPKLKVAQTKWDRAR